MAIIALQNSPSGSCHLWLKPRPKRERQRYKLGKSHAPRERRPRKPERGRESNATVAGMSGRALWARPILGTPGQVGGLNQERSRRSLHDLCGQNLERSFLATGGKNIGSIRGGDRTWVSLCGIHGG